MAVIATLAVRLQAQIAEFQAEFKEAAKSTEKFQQDFQATATKASAFGNLIAIGAAAGASALKNLAASVLENASHIVDLAAKTGLTTDTIQRFQHVAQQTGTTVDAFADASFNLGRKLAGGGDSVVAAVEKLGLSFKDIQGLSPDKQFETIAVALGKMQDSNERNRLGMILFDRTFRGIAASISEGYKKLGDDATIAGFAQLKALDAAGEAWEKFQLRTLNSATSAAGGIVLAGERIRNSGFFDIIKTFGIAATAGGDPFKAFEIFAAQQAALNTPAGKDTNLPAPVLPADYIQQLDAARKKIADLSVETRAQIDAAKKLGTTTEELTDRFGLSSTELKVLALVTGEQTKAYKSAESAAATYAAVLKRIKDAQVELTDSQKDTVDEFLKYDISVSDISKALKISEAAVRSYSKANEDLAREGLKAVSDAIKDVDQRIQDIGDTYEKDLVSTLDMVADALKSVEDRITDNAEAWEREFGPQIDAVLADIKSVEDRINNIEIKPPTRFQEFTKAFKDIARNTAGDIASLIGDGIRTGDWSQFENNLRDVLAEGMGNAAAAAVNAFVPGLGTLLQPIFSALSDKLLGALGLGTKGRDLVKDFAASFGGFDPLHARLLEMGAAGEALWIKLTQGVGRNNPAQAKAVIDEITAALDEFGTESERAAARVAGIGSAIDAINAKATAFASPFQALLKDSDVADFNAKLAAMGEKGQAEFERIGTFAAAAFAGLVKETGDAIGAIQQLGPAFQVLQDGVTKFGLTSTGTIDALIGMFALVNDAVTGPILQAIQTTGQIFKGLQEGGILTSDLFQTVATDIGASFRELEAKGGDVAKAMALSQPVLQRLWEAQQIYGDITDETTRKIIDQAEQQGLVGAHMKDVNQKILEVLIAIADVFGAKIPEGMRATQKAATDTAAAIEDEFSSIKIPDFKVRVQFDVDEFPILPSNPSLLGLASGGIVRRPTLALIGEAGPEAVVPLSQYQSGGGGGGTSTIIFEVDGRQIAAATVPYLPGEIRRYVPA